jgi:Ca2+:H+ antiporter
VSLRACDRAGDGHFPKTGYPTSQVALFVAPVLVLASLFVGPAPMDLAFPTGLVPIVFLAVLITGRVASDGRSDWIKGVQLLVAYLVLALTFSFLPSATSH